MYSCLVRLYSCTPSVIFKSSCVFVGSVASFSVYPLPKAVSLCWCASLEDFVLVLKCLYSSFYIKWSFFRTQQFWLTIIYFLNLKYIIPFFLRLSQLMRNWHFVDAWAFIIELSFPPFHFILFLWFALLKFWRNCHLEDLLCSHYLRYWMSLFLSLFKTYFFHSGLVNWYFFT